MEYRIVTDSYAGYEVQVRTRLWPFWRQPVSNTHASVEKAEAWAKRHAGVAIKYLGRLK